MTDRITPFRVDGKVEDRIDEIVLTGVDVHIEMMSGQYAWMQLGGRTFLIQAEKGKLTIALREGGSVA